MKSIKHLLAVLLLGVCLTTCGGGQDSDQAGEASEGLDKNKTYITGLDDIFVSMGYRDEKGDLVGFNVDLAREAAEIMGIQVDFMPVDQNCKEAGLEARNTDFIWNGYSITPEREKVVLFSKLYMDNTQLIIVPEDSPIETKADFKGKKITLQADSSASETVKKDRAFMDSLGGPLVEHPTNIETFKDVEVDRSDGLVVDEVLARDYLKKNPQAKMKILEENFSQREFAVGMRKEDKALAKELGKALNQLEENGKFEEIRGRYFSK